jgi:hypothetical protein
MPIFGGEPWRGAARVRRANATNNGFVDAAVGVEIASATPNGDQSTWTGPAGSSLILTYRQATSGTLPPDLPNVITVEIRLPGGAIIGVAWNPTADNQTRTFHFDSNPLNQSADSARAGMVEIYLRIQKTDGPGGAGNYDVDSRGTGAGANDQWARGKLRAPRRLTLDVLSNVALGGSEPTSFAFPDSIHSRLTLDAQTQRSITTTLRHRQSGTNIRTQTLGASTGSLLDYSWTSAVSATGGTGRYNKDFASGAVDTRIEMQSVTFGGDEEYVWSDGDQGAHSARFFGVSEVARLDHSSLKPGYVDQILAGWFFAPSNPVVGFSPVLGEDDGQCIWYNPVANQFKWRIGGRTGELVLSASPDQWHFIFAWFDATANTLNMQIDNGTVSSVNAGSGNTPFVNDFVMHSGGGFIGVGHGMRFARSFLATPSNLAAGLAVRDSLYNSGRGKKYVSLSASEKTDLGLVEYWNCDEQSQSANITGQHAGLNLVQQTGATPDPAPGPDTFWARTSDLQIDRTAKYFGDPSISFANLVIGRNRYNRDEWAYHEFNLRNARAENLTLSVSWSIRSSDNATVASTSASGPLYFHSRVIGAAERATNNLFGDQWNIITSITDANNISANIYRVSRKFRLSTQNNGTIDNKLFIGTSANPSSTSQIVRNRSQDLFFRGYLYDCRGGLIRPNVVIDAAGNHNGTLSGSTLPQLVPSPFAGFGNGYAMRFDGSTSSINLGTSLVVTGSQFCVECRFQQYSQSTFQLLASKSTFTNRNFELRIDNDKLVGIAFDGSSDRTITGTTSIVLFEKYAAALDLSGGTLRLWLKKEGQAATLEGSLSMSNIINNAGSNATFIGRKVDCCVFNGIIDEVRISNISRYPSSFDPGNVPFSPDENTITLHHLDGPVGTTFGGTVNINCRPPWSDTMDLSNATLALSNGEMTGSSAKLAIGSGTTTSGKSIVIGTATTSASNQPRTGISGSGNFAETANEVYIFDVSGRGMDLESTGTLSIENRGLAKYGVGKRGFSSTNFYSNSDSSFAITGNLSLVVAFRVDSLTTTQHLISFGGSPASETQVENQLYTILLSPTTTLLDGSGNGLTLTQVGSPTEVTATQTKFGKGRGNFSASNRLTQSSSSLRLTGDLSITMAFKVNSLGTAQTILSQEGNGETELLNVLYKIAILADGTLQYFHENGAGVDNVLESATGIVATGDHTLTLRRDTDAKSVVIKLDGVTVIDDTYANNATGGSSGTFTIGSDVIGATFLSGEIYEVRIWNILIDQGVLDNVADPDNSLYAGYGVGSELALYLMDTSAQVQYLHENGTGTDNVVQSGGGLATGNHTLTIRRDSTNKTIVGKLDGITILNKSYANNPDGGTAGILRVGFDGATNTLSRGAVYELRIWDSLIDHEILDAIADPNDLNFTGEAQGSEKGCWFFSGDGSMKTPDLSGNGRTGRVHNAVDIRSTNILVNTGFGLQLPGTPASELAPGVDLGILPITSVPFCIEARFMLTSLAAGDWRAIVSRANYQADHAGNFALYLADSPSTNKMVVQITTSVNTSVSIVGTTVLEANVPYMVAVTCDGATLRLFLKRGRLPATLEGSIACSSAFDNLPNGRTWIGRQDTLNQDPFPGIIDEVRISSVARYTETSDFAPPAEGFVADENTVGLWKFDSFSGPDWAVTATGKLATHLQLDNSTLDPALHTTNRLVTKIGYYAVRASDTNNVAYNGAVGSISLRDDRDQVSAIITSETTAQIVNENGTFNGYTTLRSWTAQIPDGGWDLWASTNGSTNSTFTAGGNTFRLLRQERGFFDFVLKAARLELRAICKGTKQGDNNPFVPGDPFLFGLAVFDIDGQILVPCDENGASAAILAIRKTGPNAGFVEYLEEDGLTWTRFDSDEEGIHLFTLTETVPGLSRFYTAVIPGENTQTWGERKPIVLGRAVIDGVSYASDTDELSGFGAGATRGILTSIAL